MTQLSSANPNAPMSTALAGLPPFKAPFPTAIAPMTSPGSAGQLTCNTQHSLAGLPCNDRALLALGASGSSVIISLEDVASIWLSELEDFNTEVKPYFVPHSDDGSSPMRPGTSDGRVKSEPSPALMPASPSTARVVASPGPSPVDFVPPLPYELFLPSSSFGSPNARVATPIHQFPQASIYPSHTIFSESPQVTPALFNYLPQPVMRSRLFKALEDTMMLHPCFNVRHFVQRVDAMFAWCENGGRTPLDYPDMTSVQSRRSSPSCSVNGNGSGSSRTNNEDLTRDVFLGSATNGKGRQLQAAQCSPKPTLSFFATTCAAFALGALVAREDGFETEPPPAPSPEMQGDHSAEARRCDPAALYALSEQAFGLFEKTSSYDVDSIVTMILQLLYLLHDGQLSVAQGVFPLVSSVFSTA